MPKGANEETYKIGLAKENQGAIAVAYEQYQNAFTKKFIPALFAMARLYLTRKYNPEKRDLIPTEYEELALDLLEKNNIPTLSKTQKHHSEIGKLLKLLNEKMSTDDLTGRAKFCQAKIKKAIIGTHVQETLGFLLTAASLGNSAALLEIEKCEAYFRQHLPMCLVKAIKLIQHHENKSQIKLAIILLMYVKNAGKTIAELSTPSLLRNNSNQEELNLIKEFNLDTIDIILSNLFKELIKEPLDLHWLVLALQWFYDKQPYNTDVANACTAFSDYISSASKSEQNIELSHFLCLLGCYFNKNGDKKKALPILQNGCNHLPKNHPFRETAEQTYKQLLEDEGNESQLRDLEERAARSEGGKVFFDNANQLYAQWKNDKNNVKLLKEAVTQYQEAALCLHNEAMNKINELASGDNPVPEAILAKIKILKESHPEPSRRGQDNPFSIPKAKKKETYFAELEAKARDCYDTQLKEEKNPKIYKKIADLRFNGILFEKNLHFARELYAKGVANHDAEAYYPYAKMCFEGDGGPINIAETMRTIGLYTENLSADCLFLRAQIHYLNYLQACDYKQDKLPYLNACILDLQTAIQLNHKDSLLLLFILHQFDGEIVATQVLARLYYHQFDSLPLLKLVEFNNFPSEKNHYCLEFYKIIYNRTQDQTLLCDIPGLKNYLAQEQQNIELQSIMLEKLVPLLEQIFANYSLHQTQQPQLESIIKELNDLCNKGNEKANFYLAKYKLLIKSNPLPLCCLAPQAFWDESRQLLLDFYSAKGEEGKLNLISTLCYELKRHDWDYPQCRLIREILSQMDKRFENYKQEHFETYLQKAEQDNGNYFEENISEDSDSDDEVTYQSASKHNTADYPRSNELAKKIIPTTLKKLEDLLKQKTFDAEKYTKQVEEIKSLYSHTISQGHAATSSEQTIEEDVQTINHFSAKGDLNTGLKIVSAPLYCAQMRGIHFKTTLWNKPMRQRFRHSAKQKERPLHNQPIYSAAVYRRAGVKDFLDSSGITQLRLKLIALYLHSLLIKLKELPPYNATEKTPLPKSAFEYNYPSRLEQLQQVYSNEYDLFHAFLQSESQQPASLFPSNSNPFVSTADILSSHAARYAYGNKPYSGHEAERLLPEYDKDGKALRPYSGAVILTLHPLADYANNDSNHVVSMNMKGDIVIDRRVIHERECSFFSYIKEQRLHFVHIAKYPSFNHQNYLRIFLHSYGLTQQLYTKFKQLITESKPHSYKRQLAVLLLGEHICTFQTLYLMRIAIDRAAKERWVIVFRDKYGNFSLKPTYDITAVPNGDDDRNRQRRFHTREIRAKRKSTDTPIEGDQDETNPVLAEQEDQQKQLQDLPSSASKNITPPHKRPSSGTAANLPFFNQAKQKPPQESMPIVVDELENSSDESPQKKQRAGNALGLNTE